LLLGLDNEGICASSGSACSTGQSTPSHVLLAIGVPSSLAYGALRVTFGEENSKEDVDYLIGKLVKTVEKLRN
jgi:cysteine desulfurase